MFRALLVAAFALMTPLVSLANPGPGAPLFRRPTVARPAPQPKQAAPAADKLDVPKSFSPPAEALAPNVTQESTSGAEVDVDEVLRRGSRVTRAGRGPMGGADRAISDATAPPPDDSHKWFFTIVVARGDKESDTLLYDLKHSPELRAWANPDEAKDSWAHVTVYVKGDESQDWRFKNLRITKYPCMVLQPPAKLANESDPKSWEWGDPSTVVWQWDGYDATLPTRATLRADAIRQAIVAYATKFNEKRQRFAAAPPPTPGSQQAATPSNDTAAPPLPALPGTPTNVVPVFSGNPSTPAAGGQQPSAQVSGGSLLLTALGMLTSGTGFTNVLLTGANLLLIVNATIFGLHAIRSWKQARGMKMLLDDGTYSRIDGALTKLRDLLTGPRSNGAPPQGP